ncbi:MAG: M28 family peptidase [Flavobacteriales bacterium]
MLMQRSLLILLPLLFFVAANAQVDSMALRYAKYISIEDLRTDLTLLASDALEGRDTGKKGQKMAAAYIREQFKQYGIPPVPAADPEAIVDGYYQPFELIEERSGSISITSGSTSMEFLKELLYFNELLKEDRVVRELVYMGDGSALVGAKGLAGKVVLVQDDGAGNAMEFLGRMRAMNVAATAAGAEVVLVASPQLVELVEEMGHFVSGGRMRLASEEPRAPRNAGIQTIIVDAKALDGLLGRNNLASLSKRKPGRKVAVDMVLKVSEQSQRVMSENVLAYIEGSDKKDELVVITAHYDHIGIEGDEIFNGADDDGSGTVAIMAIAKAFAKAKLEGNGPRRSVLVMPVTAEEKGLLGSKYYSENPVFPLENTVANLNIDMIGRIDSAHQGMAPYIYVIGSDRLSSELHTINEEANRNYTRMELDYTFNSADDPNRFYYRSDHYNFARKGVPAIFYFSGVHEDYHKSTDTIEKIRFDLVHKRALLTFHTAWILANREERIVVDGKVE